MKLKYMPLFCCSLTDFENTHVKNLYFKDFDELESYNLPKDRKLFILIWNDISKEYDSYGRVGINNEK